jgi:hypothetical protein
VHFASARVGHPIEAQAVFIDLNLGQQTTFQFIELHLIDLAFKDGFLDALPCALTDLCDAPEAAAPLGGFGVNVVTDDDQHRGDPQRITNGI